MALPAATLFPASTLFPDGDIYVSLLPAIAQPTVPAPSVSRDATIHALVGAQYGDLEFDVGKSVRWTQWFADEVFITDINTGDPRYWIVNWTETFPLANHAVTGINFFAAPTPFRAEQFREALADPHLVWDDNDWALFVDAHEGLSCDTRSVPDDVGTNPFRAYVHREITRAETAGDDFVSIPFFAFLRHVTTTVTYQSKGGTVPDPNVPNPAPGEVDQPVAVPYYLPYQGLKRLWRVGALKAPGFDWSQLDQPSTASVDAKVQLVSYAYAHWNVQDIVPPATTVEDLILANDDGWRMRKEISRVRPLTGLPFDDPHWNPSNDVTGSPGPWAFSQPGSPDPVAGSITPPAPTGATAGILVPLYDLTFRINLRDGIWYAGNNLGNIPLEYDNNTGEWLPKVDPIDWHETDTFVSQA